MNISLTVQTPDGRFNAYLARSLVTRAPAVVVLQEIFGVDTDLRQTCDDLARLGYLALSPDLSWRQEPGVDRADCSEAEWKRGVDHYAAFDYEAGVADIVATLRVARTESSG